VSFSLFSLSSFVLLALEGAEQDCLGAFVSILLVLFLSMTEPWTSPAFRSSISLSCFKMTAFVTDRSAFGHLIYSVEHGTGYGMEDGKRWRMVIPRVALLLGRWRMVELALALFEPMVSRS
jgi:hypothetical protein